MTKESVPEATTALVAGNENRVLWWAECGFAAAVTLVAVGMHLVLMLNIGALWRDEVNSVELSTMPTLRDIWQNLQFDSFPMLWFLLLRGWVALGLDGDPAFRALGCFIGIAVLAALWLSARQFGISFPFISLALLALHPMVIRYGDSMRAYGLGILLLQLTFVQVWRALRNPSRLNLVLVAVVSLAAVQTNYQNAVFLFAILSSAAGIHARRKMWRSSIVMLAIGGAAAASMLPYAAVFESASEWNMLVKLPEFGLAWFSQKLTEAIGADLVWIWLAVLASALVVGARVLLRADVEESRREGVQFALMTLLVGGIGFYAFLHVLSYFTQAWYYAALMALVAMTSEVILAGGTHRGWRIARLMVAVGAVLFVLPQAWPEVHRRHTNVDWIAARLSEGAAPDDLIVVNRWYAGVTFQRYYRGEAAWTTVPPIGNPKLHRYDRIKESVMLPNEVMDPVLRAIRETLKSGNAVWLVGNVNFLNEGEVLLSLPPAPYGPGGWLAGFYYDGWSYQIGAALQENASELHPIPLDSTQPVHPFESSPLFRASGWRGP